MKTILLGLMILSAAYARARVDTIDDAMQLFGRALLPADKVVRDGLADPSGIRDEDLRGVLPGLDEILDTAAIMIPDDCPSDMLPAKSFDLPEPQRSAYLGQFHDLMRQFHDAVAQYKAMFQDQLARRPATRDFKALSEQRQAVLDIANTAHDLLR